MAKAVTASTSWSMAAILAMPGAIVTFVTGTLDRSVAMAACGVRARREHEKGCKRNRQP